MVMLYSGKYDIMILSACPVWLTLRVASQYHNNIYTSRHT